MPVPIPTVHVTMGVATVLLCVPLALRQVPMNRFYGIRLKQAYESDERWYAINSAGGWAFIVFGLFLTGLGWFGRGLYPDATSALAPVFLAVPLLGVIPVVMVVQRVGRG